MKRFFIPIILLISFNLAFSQNLKMNIESQECYDYYLRKDNVNLIVPVGTELVFYNALKSKVEKKLQTKHNFSISAIDVDEENAYILTGDKSGQIHVYDLNGSFLKEFNIHKSIVYSVDLDPKGMKFISSSGDGDVYMADINSDTEATLIKHFKKPCFDLNYNPDGNFFVVASPEGELIVFSAKGDLLNEDKIHKGIIRDMKFIDNESIISCGDDTKIMRYNTQTDHIVRLKMPKGIKDWTTAVNADEKGISLLYGDYSGKVVFYALNLYYYRQFYSPVLKVDKIDSNDGIPYVIALIHKKGLVVFKTDRMEVKK